MRTETEVECKTRVFVIFTGFPVRDDLDLPPRWSCCCDKSFWMSDFLLCQMLNGVLSAY